MPDAGDVRKDDQPRLIPAEFQPRFQSLLETLADIDFAYDCEVDKVNCAEIDASFKAQIVTKLQQVHQERRHPYATELRRLQDWMHSRLLEATVDG